jgi:hypothetical protein
MPTRLLQWHQQVQQLQHRLSGHCPADAQDHFVPGPLLHPLPDDKEVQMHQHVL